MKINDMPKEDLETMTYSELATMILSENGKEMKIVDVFRKICELLELSDSVFESQVADFFQLVSTDKNFIVLEKGFCDIRSKHSYNVVVEEDDEEEIIENEDNNSEEELDEAQESEDDIYYDNSSDDDDVEDDELDDFMVVDDDDEAKEETSL